MRLRSSESGKTEGKGESSMDQNHTSAQEASGRDLSIKTPQIRLKERFSDTHGGEEGGGVAKSHRKTCTTQDPKNREGLLSQVKGGCNSWGNNQKNLKNPAGNAPNFRTRGKKGKS